MSDMEFNYLKHRLGKPVYEYEDYAVFKAPAVNIDASTTIYAVYNIHTGIREAEFSSFAHAINGSKALSEAVKEALNEPKDPGLEESFREWKNPKDRMIN
jgi:hypothetical protein